MLFMKREPFYVKTHPYSLLIHYNYFEIRRKLQLRAYFWNITWAEKSPKSPIGNFLQNTLWEIGKQGLFPLMVATSQETRAFKSNFVAFHDKKLVLIQVCFVDVMIS